ncbi:hypothetical protein K469DRAFT_742461 [Zopfia rhizophila CBS 207.26]|uniref:Zn(2)-C6 fungal-type domain-containing protein n=1 Tax=Zopfia rhizophila CBS 207.26 TaxID=1314779 RepID=A0A6A6DIG8_9PEZI|nr:hypothetical protein K469DRAFT_742461 [Zopfia rhizophila CBS 207.26]
MLIEVAHSDVKVYSIFGMMSLPISFNCTVTSAERSRKEARSTMQLAVRANESSRAAEIVALSLRTIVISITTTRSNTPNYAPSYASRSAGSRKVAIPRLQRHGSSKHRRRVLRACTACRSHKIKCSGDNPRCKRCESTGRECIYIIPRKDRLKIVTERCVRMSSLLKTLRRWASEEDSARISELLEAVRSHCRRRHVRHPTGPVPSNSDTDGEDTRESKGMLDVVFAGSQEQVDSDPLDLLHDNGWSRATAFVGMNSEIHTRMPQRRASHATADNNKQLNAVTFYLDSENVDLDFNVEPSKLPVPETAERLQGVYMDKVHNSFPILPRRQFEDQFRKYFEALRNSTVLGPNHKWQAILNLLVKAGWRADERDHIIYQARARTFGWNEATLTQHPDFPQIQVARMLSFYYLSVGQVSRAWVIMGMALCFAYLLGLHICNEDPSALASKQEVLVCVWWSICSLERQLSIITGRASIVVDSYCSFPLPNPLLEEEIPEDTDVASASTAQTYAWPHPAGWSDLPRTPTGFGTVEASSGSYFKAVVQIGIISQSICLLYSAGTMTRSPGEVQQDIILLGQRLDHWVASLPTEFNFQIPRSGISTPTRAFFRDTRILLTRPCRGGLWIPGKDGKDGTVPASFFQKMGSICVDAAKTEIDFLPDQPNPLFVYEYGRGQPRLGQLHQKAIRWLRSMYDSLAERAYRVAFNSLEVVASRLSLDVPDLWMDMDPFLMAITAGLEVMTQTSFLSIAMSVPHSAATAFSPFDPVVATPAFSRHAGGPFFDDSFHRRPDYEGEC